MTDTEAAAGAPAVMTQRTTVTLRLWRVKSQVKMMSTSWTPFGDESQGLKASARLDLLEIELDRARPNQPKTRAASKEKPEGHVRLEVEDSQGVSKYQWAIQEHSKYQFGVSKYQPKIHNTNSKKTLSWKCSKYEQTFSKYQQTFFRNFSWYYDHWYFDTDSYGCIYARRIWWLDSMKCIYMIYRDRDHSEGWGWGSTAVWNLSENSSDLVAWPISKKIFTLTRSTSSCVSPKSIQKDKCSENLPSGCGW